MRRLAALTAAIALLAPGCTLTMYERGLVRRVEAQKDVTPGAVEGISIHVADARYVILLKRTSEVRVQRQLIYQTIVAEGGWQPWWEPLELLTAPLYFPAMLLVFGVFGGVHDDANAKWAPGTKWKIITAPINPFCSIFGVSLERTEVSDAEVFRGKKRRYEFAMHLPISEQDVGWTSLAGDGTIVGEGTATTDVHGRLFIDAVPPTRMLRLEGEGFQIDLTLRP